MPRKPSRLPWLAACAACCLHLGAQDAVSPTPTARPERPARDTEAREKAKQQNLATFDHEDHLVYKTIKETNVQEIKLEYVLFKPTVKKYAQTPLVLYIHGGGWANLDRFVILWGNSNKALRQLVDNGIAVASIEYRLTREGLSTAYDCVVDCKDAARFFTANAAQLGIDPDRIATWGGSAGGHLCLMTALAPNDKFPGDPQLAAANPKFRAVCSWFPATTFVHLETLKGSNFDRPQRFLSMLGGPYEENMDLVKLLSPAEHLTPDTIPVLLMHGDSDKVLPVTSSQYMMDEAKRIGARNVELLVVKNADHGFGGKDIQPSLDEVQKITADYLIRHLTDGLTPGP